MQPCTASGALGTLSLEGEARSSTHASGLLVFRGSRGRLGEHLNSEINSLCSSFLNNKIGPEVPALFFVTLGAWTGVSLGGGHYSTNLGAEPNVHPGLGPGPAPTWR